MHQIDDYFAAYFNSTCPYHVTLYTLRLQFQFSLFNTGLLFFISFMRFIISLELSPTLRKEKLNKELCNARNISRR